VQGCDKFQGLVGSAAPIVEFKHLSHILVWNVSSGLLSERTGQCEAWSHVLCLFGYLGFHEVLRNAEKWVVGL